MNSCSFSLHMFLLIQVILNNLLLNSYLNSSFLAFGYFNLTFFEKMTFVFFKSYMELLFLRYAFLKHRCCSNLKQIYFNVLRKSNVVENVVNATHKCLFLIVTLERLN